MWEERKREKKMCGEKNKWFQELLLCEIENNSLRIEKPESCVLRVCCGKRFGMETLHRNGVFFLSILV